MPHRSLESYVASDSDANSACEKGVQRVKALELLREMPDRSGQPHAISHTDAIRPLALGEQWIQELD